MSEEPRTLKIREIHGLSGVTKCALKDDTRIGQDLRITDADGMVELVLSTSSYPAKLTPEQARYIALRLTEAADRVEKNP